MTLAVPVGVAQGGESPAAAPSPPRWTRYATFTAGAVFVLLFLAASWHGGSVLLHVDRPVETAVLDHRSAALDVFFRRVSWFGSTYTVLAGGALLAALAALRCRATALVIVAATALRPPIEFVVKLIADRHRPDLGRLVPGNGPSFPSGHVLASSVLWCSVAFVLALYVPAARRNRRLGPLFVAVPVVLIGCSRLYLGVHWFTDVLGGFALGTLLALATVRARSWALTTLAR